MPGNNPTLKVIYHGIPGVSRGFCQSFLIFFRILQVYPVLSNAANGGFYGGKTPIIRLLRGLMNFLLTGNLPGPMPPHFWSNTSAVRVQLWGD
jgi:hypothetical protein